VPRAIWKGALAFGLVNIPVELHTAVRDHRPRFRLLHAKDKSPVEYQRVCRREGKPVAWQDLVKGYEYERGHFVVLTKDDFETAALEKTRTIDIIDFVQGEAIDARFFDVPYYVAPDKGSDRAYAVLRDALRDSGKVGIGRVFLREVQHLAAVGVVDEAIVVTMMRFADQLVDESTLSLPSGKVDARELDLARRLIEGLSSDWNPEQYKDDYRENLMRVIKSKMTGKKPKLAEAEPITDANVVDLMTRLRESLAQGGAGRRSKASASRSSAKQKKPASRSKTSKRTRAA
jgi:DNA end-binding protein Ku